MFKNVDFNRERCYFSTTCSSVWFSVEFELSGPIHLTESVRSGVSFNESFQKNDPPIRLSHH